MDAVGEAVFIILAGSYLLKKRKKTPKKRRYWSLSLNRNRSRYSGTQMMADLLKEPSREFKSFCRLSEDDFRFLLRKVSPMITKKDTRWRKAIPPNERLAITLRFLATGDSFYSLHLLFKVSPQIISEIIPEVCEAIILVLNNVIKLPSSKNEWKRVAQAFNSLWNFPHCVGALDGKHVTIQSPINSGSEFHNYKNNFSVILMALVDAEYCFMFADCGCQGRLSDSGVYQNTILYDKITNNKLNLPEDEPLPGRLEPVPYVFVADDAFALSDRLMKPFPGRHEQNTKERIFNYRLSRARRIVENAFGILASVFRILRKPMLLEPDKVALITMTCVVLHNFLRKSKTSRSLYTPPGTFDTCYDRIEVDGSWRQDNANVTSLLPFEKVPRKPGSTAQTIRKEYAEYFTGNGQVPWQSEYAK